MTIPSEQLSSLNKSRKFLVWLLTDYNSRTRVNEVRSMASECLRHFPGSYKVHEIMRPLVDKFNKEIEECG